MSSTANNFYAMSLVPCSDSAAAEVAGQCTTNVDGQCIRGGMKVPAVAGGASAGIGGFISTMALPSLGFPAGACVGLPIFAAGNQKYTAIGWATSVSNVNPLRVAQPIL